LPTGYLPLPTQPATLNANANEQTIAKNFFMATAPVRVIVSVRNYTLGPRTSAEKPQVEEKQAGGSFEIECK
jgi:hypothetical protein